MGEMSGNIRKIDLRPGEIVLIPLSESFDPGREEQETDLGDTDSPDRSTVDHCFTPGLILGLSHSQSSGTISNSPLRYYLPPIRLRDDGAAPSPSGPCPFSSFTRLDTILPLRYARTLVRMGMFLSEEVEGGMAQTSKGL